MSFLKTTFVQFTIEERAMKGENSRHAKEKAIRIPARTEALLSINSLLKPFEFKTSQLTGPCKQKGIEWVGGRREFNEGVPQ